MTLSLDKTCKQTKFTPNVTCLGLNFVCLGAKLMVKTYKDILKVKKQALENARLKLLSAEHNKIKAQNDVLNMQSQIDEMVAFKTTSISEMTFVSENIQNLIKVKRTLEEKARLCEKEIVHYKHVYKLANIDYEKIQHLYEEELKLYKMSLEKKQALELDEIATMLFKKQD